MPQLTEEQYWELVAEAMVLQSAMDSVKPLREMSQTLMLHYSNIIETDRHAGFANRMDSAIREIAITAITGVLTLGVGTALAAVRSGGATLASLARTNQLISALPAPTGVLSRVMSFAVRWPNLGQLRGILSPSMLAGQQGAFLYHRTLQAMSFMAGLMATSIVHGNWKQMGAKEFQGFFLNARRHFDAVYMNMGPEVRTLLEIPPQKMIEVDTALKAKVGQEIARRHPEIAPAQEVVIAAKTLQLVWLDVYTKLDRQYTNIGCKLTVIARSIPKERLQAGGSRSTVPAIGPSAGY